MALCTLHPSLSALASNLEVWDSVKLALTEPTVTEPPSGPQILPLGIVSSAGNELAESLTSANKLLCDLSEGDSVLFSEQFLPSKISNLIESLVSNCSSGSLAKIVKVAPKTVVEVLEFWENIGAQFGKGSRARDLSQRVNAQIQDWTSNFYPRLRGKRVLLLSSLSPPVIAGSWVSDIVRRIGAIAPELDADNDQTLVDWNYIKSYDPHTIIFAPLGQTLDQSKKLFLELERLGSAERQAFESTSAAKRGEIFFAEGTTSFYSIDYRIIKTLGVIVSAAAGFESGYITERDTFYKLRYLELQRHKI